ncbi:MAG: PQQ-dependent sugar dehydrogenase [Bacteroidota bacterium]
MKNYFLVVLFYCSFSFNGKAQVIQIAEDFYDQQVLRGDILHPVGLAFDDNGTGYVWLKRGVVKIMDTSGVLLDEPLIDISEEVMGSGDHGLIGFALDPQFLVNGYFYLLYTVDRHHLLHYGTAEYDPNLTIKNEATIGRITRYQADPSTNFKTTLPDSRKVLIGKDVTDKSFPVLMASHGVGTLAFGTDGTLLASCGDASGFQKRDIGNAEETYHEQAIADGILDEEENVGSFKSQQLRSYAGKIIRINPQTGLGVASNPFFDAANPNSAKSKIWALGFRNPYRMVFRPETGDHNPALAQPGTFIIGDVGGGKYEELSVMKEGGANFGWPLYEGYKYAWQFWGTKTMNQDAANPLFEEGRCERPFFYFDELFKEENEAQEYAFTNFCNEGLPVPKDIPTFVHQRPILSISNASWNPPTTALVGTFDSLGKASARSVEEIAEVQAKNFDGYSILPGCFYQEGNFPDAYEGKLFIADYSGWIKTVTLDEANRVTAVDDFMMREKGIVGITQHPTDGCLYYIHHATHAIHKICYGGNPPPVAAISVDKNYGPSPLEVTFDAAASLDPFGETLTYFWDFGNGKTSTKAQPTVTFLTNDDQPYKQKITLMVTDEVGNTAQTEEIVSLNNTPPQVDITSFSDGDQYPISNASFLRLAADVSDTEHPMPDLDYTWQVFLHHNTHYHAEPEMHEPVSQTIISPLGCQTEPYWYRIRLVVKDPAGLESYDEKEVFPYCGVPIVTDFELTGKAEDSGNRLDWSWVQNIDNIEKMELFRGEKVTELVPIATDLPPTTQTFLDPQPANGLNYYQLKVTAADGVYDFSNFVMVEFPPDPLLQVFPNPVNGASFQLGLREAFSDQIQLKLFNAVGQQVADYQLAAEQNEAFEQTISVRHLENGIYWYEVENGELRYGGKVVIGN